MVQVKKPGQKPEVITLKAVAQYLGLTPGTVSAVLNDSPSARSIPQETKNRIHAAAKELNYRPNFFARTLRNKRTYTIGVIAEEIGDSYSSPIISGIEQYLRTRELLLPHSSASSRSGPPESIFATAFGTRS